MGKRGPPPKPLRQKLLESTYRKDRDPDHGRAALTPPPAGKPAELPDAYSCPPDLSDGAKAIWQEVTAELQRLGVLEMTVPSMISLYVTTAARAKQYEAIAGRGADDRDRGGAETAPGGDRGAQADEAG